MQNQTDRPLSPAICAIIVATHELPSDLKVLSERYPSVLLPLFDKPFLQHVLEFLAEKGIKRFEVISSHLSDKVNSLVGDGRRWGVSVHHHLVKNQAAAYRTVKQIARASDNSGIILADGSCWPFLEFGDDMFERFKQGPELYYGSSSDQGEEKNNFLWSGWALTTSQSLAQMPDDLNQDGLCEFLNNFPTVNRIAVTRQPQLNIQSIDKLFYCYFDLLNKNRTDFALKGNEAEKGIWLDRNVSLHPSAQLIAPVWIGENCYIGKGVRLGPYCSVGSDCMISENSILEKTIVFPGSFVGESLELQETLVDRNCMVNRRLNSELVVTENFILSSLTKGSLNAGRAPFLSRLAAAMLLVCFSPWWLSLWLWSRLKKRSFSLSRQVFVRLPAEPDPLTWRTAKLIGFQKMISKEITAETAYTLFKPARVGWNDFLFRVIPALVNVVKGELCLVGVAPRSEDQIKSLPSDWRSLYLKCKPGIITESQLNFGSSISSDQLYSADAFYSVSAGVVYDAKLLGRYILQLLGLAAIPDN